MYSYYQLFKHQHKRNNEEECEMVERGIATSDDGREREMNLLPMERARIPTASLCFCSTEALLRAVNEAKEPSNG